MLSVCDLTLRMQRQVISKGVFGRNSAHAIYFITLIDTWGLHFPNWQPHYARSVLSTWAHSFPFPHSETVCDRSPYVAAPCPNPSAAAALLRPPCHL